MSAFFESSAQVFLQTGLTLGTYISDCADGLLLFE